MKYIFLIILCSICTVSCERRKQPKVTIIGSEYIKTDSISIAETNEGKLSFLLNDEFETTVIAIIKAFQKRDAKTLNQFIHNDKGLIVIHNGNPSAWATLYTETDKIDFNKPIPETEPYMNKIKTDYKIKYEMLPEFDCNTNDWDKFGLFCDTSTNSGYLQHIPKAMHQDGFFLKENGKEVVDWRAKTLDFEELEKNSCKIVLTDSEIQKESGVCDFTFYLTLIDGKWYLTVLVRVISCVA